MHRQRTARGSAALCLVALLIGATTACTRDGPLEPPGAAIDQATGRTGAAVTEGVHWLGAGVEWTGVKR